MKILFLELMGDSRILMLQAQVYDLSGQSIMWIISIQLSVMCNNHIIMFKHYHMM